MIKNIKKSPITTILGILLILTGIFYIIYPMLKNSSYEISSPVLSLFFVFGVGLLVAPDNLLTIIKDKIKI